MHRNDVRNKLSDFRTMNESFYKVTKLFCKMNIYQPRGFCVVGGVLT